MSRNFRSSFQAILLILFFILFVNAVPTVVHFPLSKVIGPEPIVNDDFPKLLYYTEMFRHHASEHGLGVVYDPGFFAGYRTNLDHATCQLYLALGRLLPRVSTTAIIKGSSFLGILIFPLLFGAAGAIWAGDVLCMLIGGLVGIGLTHVSNHYPFIWMGNLNSLLSFAVVAIGVGLLLRLLSSRWPVPWSIAFALCCSIGFLIHPLFPVFFAPMAGGVMIASSGSVTFKRLVMVVAGALLMALTNLFWVVPMLGNRLTIPFGSFAAHVETMGKALGVSSDIPIALWYRNTLHCGLIVLAVGGALELAVRKQRSFVALVVALCLYLFMHAFKRWYLWLWPARIYVMLDLTLALFASLGLTLVIRGALCAAISRPGIQWARLRPLLVWTCAVALVVVLGRWKGFSYNSLGRSPAFVVSPTPQQQEVIDWLETHADSSARVLLEDLYYTPPLGHRFAPLAAYRTGLQFIGGPSANSQVSINRIEFHVGVLAWKPIEEYDHASLENFVRTYNIGWVLAFSKQAVATFDRYPDLFTKMDEAGGFQTYEVARPAGYFEKGRGRVGASVNRIELFDLESDNGEVVLRYHYVQGLKTSPTVTMVPIEVPDDPQPFIKLMDPPKRVTIYF